MNESRRTATPPSKAPAADRTLTILELLTASDSPLSLSEIAARAEVPLASCSAIMRTLEARGYATEQISGRTHYWQPTLAIYQLGARLIARTGLAEAAQHELERLADELGLPAHAGALEGEQVVYLAKAAGSSFVQFHTYIGRSVPFDTTALGKAIAAYLPEAAQRKLVTGRRGPRKLQLELEAAAVFGFAIEDEEEYEGIACVAAPVFEATGRCIGGISVTGLRAEVLGEDRRDRTIMAVRQTAASVSRQLGAPPSATRVLEHPLPAPERDAALRGETA